MDRGSTKRRDEVALERLEALVRALGEEARTRGTLHLLEAFQRELPAPVSAGPPPVPLRDEPSPAGDRRRRGGRASALGNRRARPPR